jgi:hypothetical protein
MSGVAPSDSGLASGLVNTTQQVGGALGLAVIAALSTTRTDGLLARGASTPSALTGGYHLAFGIGAGLVAAGIILAATLLRPEGSLTAEEERAAAGSAEQEPAHLDAAFEPAGVVNMEGDPMDMATWSVGTTARSDFSPSDA